MDKEIISYEKLLLIKDKLQILNTILDKITDEDLTIIIKKCILREFLRFPANTDHTLIAHSVFSSIQRMVMCFFLIRQLNNLVEN